MYSVYNNWAKRLPNDFWMTIFGTKNIFFYIIKKLSTFKHAAEMYLIV